MYYSTHLVAGATVGYLSGDPVIGFLAGTASHMILDVIPHHDFRQVKHCLMETALGSIAFLMYLIYGHPNTAIVAGAIGGTMPDVEVGLYQFKLIKRKYFPSHSGFLNHRQAGLVTGLLTQFIIMVAGLLVIS